jgi:hypothetical protein
MRRIFIASVMLCGCSTLPAEPAMVETFRQPYDRLGACVFSRISERDGIVGLTYAEMRGAGRASIRSANQNVAVYEVAFIDQGGSTRVEIKSMPTIYGRDGWGQILMPYVRECAA